VRRGALMFGAWALWVGALALTLGVWGEAEVPLILFGGAAAAAALAAGYLLVRPPGTDPPRTLADTSAAPPLIAAGIVFAANGLAFGLWLVLIGAELAAFGLGLLVAELRRSRGG
jgi:hypothetical protein